MRNEKNISYVDTKYGYIYQPKHSKKIDTKISNLKEVGCTSIICDLGDRKNLDALLDKAKIRDRIVFYDHSVFQTVSELHDMYELGLGEIDGSPSFTCEFYDWSLYHDLAHTPEDTAKYRKRNARRRRIKSVSDSVSKLVGFE